MLMNGMVIRILSNLLNHPSKLEKQTYPKQMEPINVGDCEIQIDRSDLTKTMLVRTYAKSFIEFYNTVTPKNKNHLDAACTKTLTDIIDPCIQSYYKSNSSYTVMSKAEYDQLVRTLKSQFKDTLHTLTADRLMNEFTDHYVQEVFYYDSAVNAIYAVGEVNGKLTIDVVKKTFNTMLSGSANWFTRNRFMSILRTVDEQHAKRLTIVHYVLGEILVVICVYMFMHSIWLPAVPLCLLGAWLTILGDNAYSQWITYKKNGELVDYLAQKLYAKETRMILDHIEKL